MCNKIVRVLFIATTQHNRRVLIKVEAHKPFKFQVEQEPHGVFKRVFGEHVQTLLESIDDGIKIFQIFFI